ncbi:MAG: MBL fold metallo-hydrolase [Actinobacteria bacterium]|nr:MBL fold metallo-hydrolase [Actinomycetota bacterium]
MLDRFVWFKQASYQWRGDGLMVYIDPWGVTRPDPADVIFITHAHYDHFSLEDIERIRKADTRIVAPHDIAQEVSGDVLAVRPGDSIDVSGIRGEAVPAYNVSEERLEFHPRANGWVGYVLDLGGHRYYHAGDTDRLPDLDQVRADVAFLPVGGTYTMDVTEAAGLARAIGPELAVPMHYGFVAGTEGDGQRFADEAAPVPVQLMKPENPFSQ